MSGANPAAGIVRFGEYEADVAAGHLRRRGTRIRLRGQAFDVLALLVERAGQVVTREELQHRLWPGHVFVDFDNNLNTAVARLREALHDSAVHPRYIETLPKHGYRFIGGVSETLAAPNHAIPKTRLVVLPFANTSGKPAQDYLSDAITDEITTELARMAPDHLGVIARTTAMRYKSSTKDVARIGRELEVEYLVEGSVRGDERLVVNVQLIRACDQSHVWAKRYEADRRDIFALETRIAGEIADRSRDLTRRPRSAVRRPPSALGGEPEMKTAAVRAPPLRTDS